MRTLLPLALLAFPLAVRPEGAPAAEKPEVRATVELLDGSRLIGTPADCALQVTLGFTKAGIPLDQIRECEVLHKEERVVLSLANGDRLTGILERAEFPLETILGRLAPTFAQIDKMSFSARLPGVLPTGQGSIAFGGVNWLAWRTEFEVSGDMLLPLPKARPGYNYGHGGNGRGPFLVTNIGSAEWKDYRVEFDYCFSGVDPALNPHGLPPDYRAGGFVFHVADAKESWNEKGGSYYGLGIAADGKWELTCVYNSYCNTPVGYGNPTKDGERMVVRGEGLATDPVNGNRFRLDVRGDRIAVWMDNRPVVDVRDEKMRECIGGTTLDHGGFGFSWGWENMGWVRNFSATKL